MCGQRGGRAAAAAPLTTAQLFGLSLLILLLQLSLRPVPELAADSAAKSTQPQDISVHRSQQQAFKVIPRLDFAHKTKYEIQTVN